jgi:hypothetical protein
MSRGNSRQYRALTNSSIHFERYAANKSGKSVEEIAEEDHVKPEAIRRSIETVEIYRHKNTADTMNQVLISVVQRLETKLLAALERGLGAQTEIHDDKGKVKKAPDHAMQIKAAAEVRQIAQVVQPKAAPQLNVGVGVGINSPPTRVATGSYIGMEDRLREIRKLREGQATIEGRTAIVLKELEGTGEDFTEANELEDEAEEAQP